MAFLEFLMERALRGEEDFPRLGEIGFMQNRFWRQSGEFANLERRGGGSHPGIGTGGGMIAFGTTAFHGRDGKPDSQLLVESGDCPVLRERTLFLLKSRLPAIPGCLDLSKTEPGQVRPEVRERLRSKLLHLQQAAAQ